MRPPMLLVSIPVALTVLMGRVTAAAACNPGRTKDGNYYYDGFGASGLGTIGGTYATVLASSPYTNGDETVMYVKIYDNSSGDAALMEWEKTTGNPYEYAFWHDTANCGSGPCGYAIGSPSVGAHNTYTVLFNNCASNKVNFEENGSGVGPCQAVDFTPNAASSGGGIYTLANQMPGGTSTKETITGAEEYSNGTWHSYMNNAVHNTNGSSYFGYDVPTNYNAD